MGEERWYKFRKSRVIAQSLFNLLDDEDRFIYISEVNIFKTKNKKIIYYLLSKSYYDIEKLLKFRNKIFQNFRIIIE